MVCSKNQCWIGISSTSPRHRALIDDQTRRRAAPPSPDPARSGAGTGLCGVKRMPGLTRAADHLNRDDRVAAQFEEVVVDADALKLEHVLPDRRQLLLQLASRRHVTCCARPASGLRQRIAVELAVGGQRHCVEHQQMRRHHVIRQTGLQDVRAATGANRRRRSALTATTQATSCWLPLTSRRQHHRLRDGRVALQACLDLAQLDAEAANLHLMVDAPDVLDAAVGAIARQIAGAIQARARLGGEQVRDKARGGQVGALVITPRQTGTADVQLADATLGHRVQVAGRARTSAGRRSARRSASCWRRRGRRGTTAGRSRARWFR